MPSWIESVFEFLFKYRPAVFARGDLVFGAPRSVILLLLIAAVIGIPAVLSYVSVRGKSTRRDRWVLGALRTATLVAVVVCLFRPMLLLSEAIPQRNFVGVLIDDSRSMLIADRDGRARGDFVRSVAGGPDSALLASLRERFQVRLYRFGATADRIESMDSVRFGAGDTHLADALERAREDLESVPLSGLVVLTDGADNARTPIADRLLALRARSVPVFAVGIGAESYDRDVEVRRVEAPRVVLRGTALTADLLIRQRGLGGERVPVIIEDDGRIIAQDTVELPRDSDVVPVRVHAVLARPGARTITFRIPQQRGEQVTQNNAQQALVTVRDTRERILYVEGEPRHEVRFIREAIAADSNLQLVTLQRTGDKRFLRLDIDEPAQLANGFPTSRAELFQYRALVIGSVEASFFSADQLQMIADFVSQRGGGALFLGGRRAFAEGGYTGTPVADVLPVVIEGPGVADSATFLADLVTEVTRDGRHHAVTQIGPSAAATVARWRTLAPVTTVNFIRRVKPGAVTLLAGTVPADGRAAFPSQRVADYAQPVLAYQRFGRGIAIAMPVQDSWQWQMDSRLEESDRTFTLFWRQLLRWVTSDVPGGVRIDLPADRFAAGGAIPIRASVADSLFVARNDADVVARVRAPSGTTTSVPLEWVVDRDGEYRGAFTAAEEGLHTIAVEATPRGGATAHDSLAVAVGDLNGEFIDAEMRAPLLQRIAEETGGRFYRPSEIGRIAEDVALSRRGVTVVNQMDLWDMPAMFLVLIALMSAEWAYRKSRGLA